MLENHQTTTNPSHPPALPRKNILPVNPTAVRPGVRGRALKVLPDTTTAPFHLNCLLDIDKPSAPDGLCLPPDPLVETAGTNRSAYVPRPAVFDPIGSVLFPRLLALEPMQRLMLLHEASLEYTDGGRAEAIALTGHVGSLFAGACIEPKYLRRHWKTDGQMVGLVSAEAALRNAPSHKAQFDAAVEEVHQLFAILDTLPGDAVNEERVCACYLRRYALVQLNAMSPEARRRALQNGDASRLGSALGIRHLPELMSLQRMLDRHRLKDEPLPAFPHDALLFASAHRLEPAKHAAWMHVAAVLAAASTGPLPTTKRQSVPRIPQPYHRMPRALVHPHERLEQPGTASTNKPMQDPRQMHIAILLTDQPAFSASLKQLRMHFSSWNGVSAFLGLAAPGAENGLLHRFMTGSEEDRAALMAEARAYLRDRARTPGNAATDQASCDALLDRAGEEVKTLDVTVTWNKRLRGLLVDDFIVAAWHLTPRQRAACIHFHGPRNFLQRLDLEAMGNIMRVLTHDGCWHPTLAKRRAHLEQRMRDNTIQRPQRVALIRESLVELLKSAGALQDPPVSPGATTDVQPGEGSPSSISDQSGAAGMETDSSPGVWQPVVIKPEPELVMESVQRYSSTIVAETPQGGDWLAGLDLNTATVSPEAWRTFEVEALLPARFGALRRAALQMRLQLEIPAMLSKPASEAELAEAFEFVTTLDDGHERGRGVVLRRPLQAYTLLFPYGGTVCADSEASEAWRVRYPDAWKYAMCVNLPGTVVTDDNPGSGATCYGYPAGSMATIVNTRQLHGSEQQLRKAANVAALAVTVPGLPFAIPVLITIKPLEAGAELFFNYGLGFSRYVQSSLRSLPRWPTVKMEPGLRPPPTFIHFLAAYHSLPRDGLDRLPHQASEPDPTADALEHWPAWLAQGGFEIRHVPPGGDSCLQSLEGHSLDAQRMQEVRHDLADVIARQPDTEVSDTANAHEVARLLRQLAPHAPELAGPYPRRVPNEVMADLQRVADASGSGLVIEAWCRLNDERQRSRAPAGRHKPAAPTQVAVLAEEGELILHTAAGRRSLGLGGLDDAARRAAVGSAIAASQVALLRNGAHYREIVSQN